MTFARIVAAATIFHGATLLSAATAILSVEQWRLLEIKLTSDKSYADPFNDVQVDAVFLSDKGIRIRRPAFWDGGNTWKVRFAPTDIGTWRMTTTSTDQQNSSLNNVLSTITCAPYSGDLEIFKHGFIKISADKRYFTYADGAPFFYLGDTHWLISHERFAASNVPGVESEFKYIVDKRVEQGFSVYQTEPIQHRHGGKHDSADEEPFYNLRDGVSEADMAGFRNLDQKFQYIADKGLVNAAACLCWALDPAKFPDKYPIGYMKLLGRYWSARYGAFPMLWTVAQEVDPNMYGQLDGEALQKWITSAEAVVLNDDYGHPLTAHMQNTLSGVSPASSSWAKSTFHSWWAVQWPGPLKGGISPPGLFWADKPTKPVVLYEPNYEGFWTDSYGVRTSAYFAFQNGMCGYGYGASGVWNDAYSRDREDWGTDYEMPERFMSWYDGANLPGATQLSYLKKFYLGLKWWKLAPLQPGLFLERQYSATMSSDGDEVFVIYFYEKNVDTGILYKLRAATPYLARWFDPRSGQFMQIGRITATNGRWQIPKKPSDDDWLLVLERVQEGR